MFKGVIWGISSVADGNMSVRWGREEEVLDNRRKFLDRIGIEYEDCVMASLLSGTDIVEVNGASRGLMVEGDALLTREPELGLLMLTADCYPVIIFDPGRRTLGLVHLGRQGIDGGLAGKVISAMTRSGSRPGELQITIGPGLGKESYAWEGKLPFDQDWGEYAAPASDGRWRIDMEGMLVRQLADAGVDKKNIRRSGTDVFTDKKYFSHVRSVKTGEPEGRFMTAVVMQSR